MRCGRSDWVSYRRARNRSVAEVALYAKAPALSSRSLAPRRQNLAVGSAGVVSNVVIAKPFGSGRAGRASLPKCAVSVGSCVPHDRSNQGFAITSGINTPGREASAAKASLPLFAGEGFAQILGMVGKSGFDFGPAVDGKFACLIKRLTAGEFFAMPDGRRDVVCFHVGSLYHNRLLRCKGVK